MYDYTSKKELNKILTDDKIVYFDYNIESAIKTFNEKNVDLIIFHFFLQILKNRNIKKKRKKWNIIKSTFFSLKEMLI